MEHGAHLDTAWELLAAALTSGEAGALTLALFLAGLVGGFAHCAGMCGPFVLGQVGAALGDEGDRPYTFLSRLGGAALAPYHLGRATTYTAMGAIGGGLTGAAGAVIGLPGLSAALLAFAAVFFVFQAVGGARSRLSARTPGRSVAETLSRRLQPWLADPRGLSGYALGVALGFLPCGLLYGALAAAAGSGSFAAGALGMAGFTLGTVPSLVGVGYLGAFFGRRWLGAARRVARPLLLFNAGLLAVLAVRSVS